MLPPTRLHALLERFAGRRVLVVGDLMLDEFVWGRVARISPEAPVPVVEVSHTSAYPGGAANVARNLREFTPHVAVMGLVGTDEHAGRLRDLLAAGGIALDLLQEDDRWQTIVKTRVIARQQHVVRVDRERRADPALLAAAHGRALAQLDDDGRLGDFDAIIVEDYGKGFLDQPFVDALTARAGAAGVQLTVDPNPRNPLSWRGATAVKPNRTEAFAAAGLPALTAAADGGPGSSPERDADLLAVGRTLLARWQPEAGLLITLGEQGMMLFEPGNGGGAPVHLPTRAREVFDLSGAGDTAIALFTLALAAGGTATEAAEVANHAAGVVVGKLGTATVTPAELTASFGREGWEMTNDEGQGE